ncbi:MAG: flippase-like domain-containing protein [Polyangiales bacterium]
MNRATLIRGIQLVIAITLGTFAFLLWRAVSVHRADLSAGLADLHPGWIAVASVFALQEGVCGGTRMFVLSRVLCPEVRYRTVVASEFVLMFVGGVTPGQLGAPVAQVATLVEGGMPFTAIATAELLTAFCTMSFFLLSAVALMSMRAAGLLAVPGAEALDVLVGFSALVFGAALAALLLCVLHPPFLKAAFRAAGGVLGAPKQALVRLARRTERLAAVGDHPLAAAGALTQRLVLSVDRVHDGFRVYARRGKLALATAFGLTVGFFWARFSVAYFLLLGLGLSTTPRPPVAPLPDFLQVIAVQSLLNFALYLSPTPGASGVAETGSNVLMSPWVDEAHALPYLVLWRVLALFLCMFIGGTYVFRYLGTDVLERRAKEAEAARRALEPAPRAEGGP